MQEVLEFVLKNITTSPDDVSVETHEEDGVINFTISVHSDDVGRIIGKEGKVIKAIRTIMRVIAIQKGVRVRVSVLSDQDGQSPSPVVAITEEAPASEETVEILDTPEEVKSEEVVVEITPEPAPEEDSLTVEV